MKLMRFKTDKHPGGCLGRVEGKTVSIMAGDIFAGDLKPTGEKIALNSISDFMPPVDPPNVIAIGANYIDHCKECNATPPTQPLVFIKATNSVTAHGKNIILPAKYPDQVDYEAELAVVIGKEASYVSEDDAMNYVLGYTCANDVSARDVQLKIDSQWARGKSFDTFCPIGPWIATDIEAPEKLRVKLILNGQEMQNQPVSDMTFSVAKIIAHLSAGMTLLPGTVILTGTPSGVGFGRNPQVFLKPGDVVDVVIDEIGVLRNPVVCK